MIKEIPILFSTSMVQAILEGRKSQTRRLVKHPKNVPSNHILIPDMMKDKSIVWYQDPTYSNVGYSQDCPHGKPGEILWVREKFCFGRIAVGELPDGRDSKPYVSQCTGEKDFIPYEYCLSDDIGIEDVTWKPSIHMRKEYARIWLKVESVRVERLQDISEEDALAEGIEPVNTNADTRPEYLDYIRNELRRIGETKPWGLTAFGSFRSLWEKINGADSWLANPWVWVVSFTVVSTDGKPSPLTEKVEQ